MWDVIGTHLGYTKAGNRWEIIDDRVFVSPNIFEGVSITAISFVDGIEEDMGGLSHKFGIRTAKRNMSPADGLGIPPLRDEAAQIIQLHGP